MRESVAATSRAKQSTEAHECASDTTDRPHPVRRRSWTAADSPPRRAAACCVPAWPSASPRRCCRPAAGAGHRRRSAEPDASPRPDNPVTWPTSPTTTSRSPTGSQPEKGATLQALQLRRLPQPAGGQGLRGASTASRSRSRRSTTPTRRSPRSRSGSVDFDIYFPNYDQISRLVTGGLVRPLNHSYIPNIKNVWPQFTNPWYDQGWRYTRAVHHLHHRHRLAHRPGARRHRRAGQPLRLAVGSAVQGQDRRSSTTGTPRWRMVLLQQGHHRRQHVVERRRPRRWSASSCTALVDATSPKVTITMYNDLPAGQIGLSPDVVRRHHQRPVTTCPRAVGPEILRYWFPADGNGWSTTT